MYFTGTTLIVVRAGYSNGGGAALPLSSWSRFNLLKYNVIPAILCNIITIIIIITNG